MVTPIAKALKAGVKVINIDVELDKDAKKAAGDRPRVLRPRQPRRREDWRATRSPQKLGPGGKVVILEGNPEADNAVQRKLGFMDSVDEGKLQLLDSKTAHWETEEANTLMTNFLTQYHDIQGVMAANDSMALGVVKALDAAGLERQDRGRRLRQHPGRAAARSRAARCSRPSSSTAPTWRCSASTTA